MGVLLITENKKARFDYTILQTFEAGIELRGSEVKSLRDGHIQLKDSYVSFRSGEAFLQNAHISEYKNSSYNNHEPERLRKLLLNRSELTKIETALTEKGLTCLPLKVYFKNGYAKIEIGLAQGKKIHDKRQAIKKRDAESELRKSLRRSR